MLARIYKPGKPATQSGAAKSHEWLLRFEPAAARRPDPLMGWTQTTDTRGQVQIAFDTREEAVAFAQRQGIPFEIVPEPPVKKVVKAYADNFAFNRRQPWTH
jgi:hypothetical protein